MGDAILGKFFSSRGMHTDSSKEFLAELLHWIFRGAGKRRERNRPSSGALESFHFLPSSS